jgi:peroxiredoxin
MSTPLLLMTIAVLGADDRPLKPGDAAPAFALKASTGATVKLADFAGKTLVLAFFPKAFTSG